MGSGCRTWSERTLFSDPRAYDSWAVKWRQSLENKDAAKEMRAVNPLFIPRNHRIEQAISAAVSGDFAPFEKLLAVLARPFDDQPQFADYADPPKSEEIVHQTFCGT